MTPHLAGAAAPSVNEFDSVGIFLCGEFADALLR
jgi:hypothetical protein